MRGTAARLTVEHRLSARRPPAISIMDGRLRNCARSRDLERLTTSVRARSADVHVHSVLLATPLRDHEANQIGPSLGTTWLSSSHPGHRPLFIGTAPVGPVKHTGCLTGSGPAARPASRRRCGNRSACSPAVLKAPRSPGPCARSPGQQAETGRRGGASTSGSPSPGLHPGVSGQDPGEPTQCRSPSASNTFADIGRFWPVHESQMFAVAVIARPGNHETCCPYGVALPSGRR
jgi:hypothetical protein